MTRIRDLLISFRSRQAREFRKSDSVSFESFCNENPRDSVTTKESSLSNGFKTSPKCNKGREYVRFSPRNVKLSDCTRPSLATILLLVLLSAVFLILPVIYLLHCFGVIHVSREDFQHSHYALKAKEHYAPSSAVHELLQQYHHKDPNTFSKPRSKIKALPPPPKPDYAQCAVLKDIDRFDCFPEDGSNRENCEARGCCWMPIRSRKLKNATNNADKVPLDVPYCFYPPNYSTYKYVNFSETAFGFIAFLKRNYRSPYPGDVETLQMTVRYEAQNRLRIKFTDPHHIRFEPQYPEMPIVDTAAVNLSYSVVIDPMKSGFKVVRKLDNTSIFDSTSIQNMIFSDQFLQMSSRLPSTYIYGIGEHRNNLMLSTQWQRFTLFNHDGVPTENTNLYGSHPFYLSLEKSGNSHGVLLMNSNAMDVILQPTPAITFRPIGGILDFFFFLGPTPADVISQYTDLIGRPTLPPYWALGFHLCRFGYKTLNNTRLTLQRNLDAGILIDTQWNDLDYMNSSNDFTYDHQNFKGLPQFVKELHLAGRHYIPLIDPGVSASEVKGSYPPYDKGLEMDIFVKNSTGQPFVGKVWNRASTVWPDFTHIRTVDYWTLMLRSMHEAFQFDGAWIDMNEPSNFLSGSFTGCPNSSLETPPYLPAVIGGQLIDKTLCMTAQHFAGFHYDVHNLYGFAEAIVTNFALAEIRGKRPMVISRASFPGLGHYAGHWSGDVYSLWHDMRYSVPQLLSFSLFGIPLMGADICGFNGNTTAALCNRWSQLGAFYPFSRNHNTDDGIDQDPVALGPAVVESAKKALTVRYELLPYLYTLFWAAHVQGDTVARPLFFQFPNDSNTYNIDDSFLWGSGILIIPVFDEGQISVSPYLPAGIWYDYYTKISMKSNGEKFTLSAPLDTIPVLIHGGNIIPQQKPNVTTTESRKSKIELLAAPALDGSATGNLYWDDGDSLNVIEERKYCLLRLQLKPGELQSNPVWWSKTDAPPNLGVVTILGVNVPVTEVMVNHVSQTFKYDTIHKYLLIEDLDVSLSASVLITWK